MKDKGFTLIELIVTITLIVIISVTVGVSITGMLDRQEEKDTEDYVNQIQDAACVYANVSTAFTDGAQFGFGAEIGISTQKLHARGPMALRELTSYKYLINGDGQVRS